MVQTAGSGPPLLVFTGPNGTLLDHESYGWSPARPALNRLAALGALVVPATSKTQAEVAPLMAALGLTGPAIVENGAGVAGIAPDAAARAHAREFLEPGLWSGGDAGLAAFAAALVPHGLTLRRGGRFIHVLPGADKAARMAEIRASFPPCPVIARGDAPNDAAMLTAADIAITVPNPAGPPPFAPGAAPVHARHAPAPGPTGWNAAALKTLTDLGFQPVP